MDYPIIFLNKKDASVMPNIIICLPVGQIKSFGKFVYQSNNILKYVASTIFHALRANFHKVIYFSFKYKNFMYF